MQLGHQLLIACFRDVLHSFTYVRTAVRLHTASPISAVGLQAA